MQSQQALFLFLVNLFNHSFACISIEWIPTYDVIYRIWNLHLIMQGQFVILKGDLCCHNYLCIMHFNLQGWWIWPGFGRYNGHGSNLAFHSGICKFVTFLKLATNFLELKLQSKWLRLLCICKELFFYRITL